MCAEPADPSKANTEALAPGPRGPGWAVFMTQNLDRTFSEALSGAMALARERRSLEVGAPVRWREVLRVLDDQELRRQLADQHGDALVERVRGSASHASADEQASPPHYHAPDRSDFVPNQLRNDPDMPEGDLGACATTLADGRAAVVERWFSEGATLVTLFFSALDLEDATLERLLELTRTILERERVPTDHEAPSSPGVMTRRDGAGRWVFSMTFVVSLPE